MTDLLFASPWWLLGSVIAVGAMLFWSGNTRQQKGPQRVGISLIVLAMLLKTISFFVETDKEKVTRHTSELVAAVQSRDWDKFSSLLDDDVSLNTPAGTIFPNRDVLVKGAKSDTEIYNLTNLSAHITGIAQDETGVTVDLNASCAASQSLGYPIPSSWRLTWDHAGKDWRLHEVTCLSIANEKVDRLGELIGK